MNDTSSLHPRPSRSELDLERFASIMLGNLDQCYLRCVKKNTPHTTFDQFLIAIGLSVHEDTEDPMQMIKQAFTEEDAIDDRKLAELALGPIIVSAIFILRALGEWRRQGDLNKAWSYMSDGCYWAGVSVAGKGLGAAKRLEEKKFATSGGNGKKAVYEKIKKRAFELVELRRPPLNGWPSRWEAANKIKDELNMFVSMNFKHLEPVKVKTIDVWLSSSPEFPAQPKGRP